MIHVAIIVPWTAFRSAETPDGVQTYIAVNLRVAEPVPTRVPAPRSPRTRSTGQKGGQPNSARVVAVSGDIATPQRSDPGEPDAELTAEEDSEATTAVAAAPPEYPEAALRNRLEGCVLASITVSVTGEVSDVKIVATDHPNVFDQSVIESQQTARYIPARKSGEARESRVLAVATFVLSPATRINCPLRMASEARRQLANP